jgi:hypothetical protein
MYSYLSTKNKSYSDVLTSLSLIKKWCKNIFISVTVDKHLTIKCCFAIKKRIFQFGEWNPNKNSPKNNFERQKKKNCYL